MVANPLTNILERELTIAPQIFLLSPFAALCFTCAFKIMDNPLCDMWF